VLICRGLGRRSVVTGGADDLAPFYKARSTATRLLLKASYVLLYSIADRVMVVSTSDRANLSRIAGGRKLYLVPHAVDVKKFAPKLPRAPRTLLTIGWLGRGNVIRKGMDSAIRLLAELRARDKDFSLTIAGLSRKVSCSLTGLEPSVAPGWSVQVFLFHITSTRFLGE